jgi:hypothetical protein
LTNNRLLFQSPQRSNQARDPSSGPQREVTVMARKRMARFLIFFAATVLVAPAVNHASGGSPMPPPSMPNTGDGSMPPFPKKSPTEEAVEHYNAGLQHRDKALAFLKESSQAGATEKEKEKLENKAHKEFGKAIDEFRQSTRLNPKFFQAHSDLGFALRKTGDYNAALESYNVALSVAPEYGPAIEYRGEAYLGLDRVEDAKQSYMQLFPKDREHADELLSAMKGWVAKRTSDPGAVTPEVLQSFSGWVQEREELAKQTPTVSELQIRKW